MQRWMVLGLVVAFVALAPFAHGQLLRTNRGLYVYHGATEYASHDSYGTLIAVCHAVDTSFSLALPSTGDGVGSATYVAPLTRNLDCTSRISPDSAPYSERLQLVVPFPTMDGGVVYDFERDHFVSDGHGGWVDVVHYQNGDLSTTRITAEGHYAFTYLFANGSGYGFEGDLTAVAA